MRFYCIFGYIIHRMYMEAVDHIHVIAYRRKVVFDGQVYCHHGVRYIPDVIPCRRDVQFPIMFPYLIPGEPRRVVTADIDVEQLRAKGLHVVDGLLGVGPHQFIEVLLYRDAEMRLHLLPRMRVVLCVIDIRLEYVSEYPVILLVGHAYLAEKYVLVIVEDIRERCIVLVGCRRDDDSKWIVADTH